MRDHGSLVKDVIITYSHWINLYKGEVGLKKSERFVVRHGQSVLKRVTCEETLQSAFELIKSLWEQIMLLDDSKISEIIRKPWPLLFEATKQGNLAFLNIISVHIRSDI